MEQTQSSHRPTNNLMLAALPAHEYSRLSPHLRPITLALGQVLYHADEPIRQVYFLTSGMASLLSTTALGETIEVAMVGSEGMLGVPIIWGNEPAPYQVMVQIAGTALSLKAALLKDEFNRHGRLHDLLLRHTHALVKQICQSAICNRFHSISQRLCRWLLIAHDHIAGEEILLTQDSIAYMLGSRRERVTEAANMMQKRQLIRYKRGRIVILNRRGLESASCECYPVIKERYHEPLVR